MSGDTSPHRASAQHSHFANIAHGLPPHISMRCLSTIMKCERGIVNREFLLAELRPPRTAETAVPHFRCARKVPQWCKMMEVVGRSFAQPGGR